MPLNSFVSNQGTMTPILTDNTGGVSGTVIAIQKVDISPLGTAGTIWNGNVGISSGTITSLPNLAGGTIGLITRVGNVGTLELGTVTLTNPTGTTVQFNNGTIDLVKSGTITKLEGGTVQTNILTGTITRVSTIGTLEMGTISTLPNLPGGSIVITTGTIVPHGITAATITEGTLRNLISGTINSATVVINSATISVLPNLPQGSINVTAGTVNAGTINVGTITAGSIRVVAGTVGGAGATAVALSGNPIPTGGVDSGGTVYGFLVDIKGQQLIGGGTIDMIKAGTITTLPNLPGGTITRVSTIGTLEVGTISALPNLPQGSINVTAGTITAGTVGGKAASAAIASGNPVFTAGTDPGGTIYGFRVDTSGVLQVNGTVVTGGAGTQAVRLIDGTLTNLGTLVGAGTVTNLGSVTNLGTAKEVTTVANVSAGSITVIAGTVGGKAASGAAAVANPVFVAGTAASGSVYGLLTDTSGVLQINGTVATGGAGTQPVRLIDGTLTSVSAVTPGVGATNLGKAEDAAHTTGDVGVMVLGVRNDDGTPLAGSNGDYIPVTTDSTGALRIDMNGTGSTNNSSTATLTANSVFTGTSDDTINYNEIRVSVFSDQVSATNGLSIQQSSNGTNWDITDTYTISASTGSTFAIPRQARYVRVVYTNGGVNQTTFRLATILNRIGTMASSQRAGDAYTNETDLQQEQSFLMGYNGATWDRLRSTTANGLAVDVTRISNGSVAVTAGTVVVTGGSIVHTAGTLNAGTINTGTITAGTLTNLVSGTINALASGTLTGGTLKDNLGALGTFTITVAALASSTAGVGRQSTLIDNTTNLFSGALVAANITVGSVTTANNLISLYLIRSDNSSIRDDAAGTGDAAWTQKNAPLLGNILVPTVGTAVAYQALFDTSTLGHLGPQWGVAVVHNLGNNLHATAGSQLVTYTAYNARF